ncbi:autotransporter-associated N-terminal domain-containing protein [Fusobacterium periodonticum]|uniref:Outer membrane protein n=1 Tax=Fusobacterium periodonticum 1_1_41FAA TaxID=469621 RepID=D6LIP0_9FUSO|nr:autotransporter-associated N-terminal domain-containing protein [Fusobacterium periodonticum]EFG28266.1 autotransporter beta-domain protein [Fusobacterium periodonticum 1_1_41FAA]
MTKNSLHAVEQNLRSIAKRYKSVKYSIGLAILFLMMGLSAFSEEVMSTQEIVASRENLRNSVESLQTKVSDARRENQKEIDGLRLELVKLMEQGNQVVKSPWASWQFGVNYVYNNMSGMYKGRGDKPPKYVYNSIYRRGNWEERNALDVLAGKTVNGGPITPGNENTNTWQITNGLLGGANLKRDLSIDASTNGGREWGLVDLRKIREPLNEIEILARVSPKEVKKDKLDIPVSVTPPATLSAPVVKPNVNKPTEAPKVELPKPPVLEIPGDPNLTFNPTISVLKVEKVGEITVNPEEVTPVDFFIDPNKYGPNPGMSYANASVYKPEYWDNKTETLTDGKYFCTWGVVPGKTTVTNLNLNVVKDETRAIVVDEGRDPAGDNFTYVGGTIRLNNKKNAGIDVQGTHMGQYEAIYPMVVKNLGTIIGVGATGVEEHAGFAFNNFDSSDDSTRVSLINDKEVINGVTKKGTIELNTPKSAGMMLRPEINQANNRYQGGLNMQFAENKADITVNGRNSVGITIVKNPKNAGTLRTDLNIIIPKGGLLASRSDAANKSAISNTGTINVQGDDSVGVSILNTIQEVKVNGIINIGTVNPTSLSANGGSPTLANRTSGGTAGKVEGSVGVYTQVATRPVRARVYRYDKDANDRNKETEVIAVRYYDDHGRENTIENATGGKYTDSKTNSEKDRHTGQTVGTETVEVGGTINIGKYASGSYGLRNNTSKVDIEYKDKSGKTVTDYYITSGSITLTGSGKVLIDKESVGNFGAVSAGDKFDREVIKSTDKDPNRVQTRESDTGKVDIHGLIKAEGAKSIGYVMLSGEGTNTGTIEVIGHNDNKITPIPGTTKENYEGSLGFYGVKGTFNNAGTIKTKDKLAHSVVVKNLEMTFNHKGTIEVDSPNSNKGNIGVFSDGKAKVNFYNNSNVFVKANSVGIYSADKDKFNTTFTNHGKLNIEIGKDSTFAYLDGNATTPLEKFFVKNADGKAVSVNILGNMGANSSLVYANDEAKALLNADYTITQGDKNASTIALLATNKSSVIVDTGKKLTTNTQVALAAVDGIVHPVGSTTVSGSTAENKGIIVSNRTNDGIGIYARDNGSKAINDGTITMNGTKAVGMYGENVTTLENKTGKSIEVKEEQSAGMYARVTGDNTLTAQNNGKIITNKQKSVGIYLKNDTTLPTGSINPAASKLTASNKEIEIKGGTESIGIYAPASTVSRVGKVTMADTVTKSIAVYLSKGAQVTSVAKDEINLGTSTKNIAYFIKNENTGFAASSVLGKVFGYGVGVYLEGDTTLSPTDVAKLTAASPDLNFKQGTATGDGIVGLYLKGNTDISTYNKTITVGNTVVDNKTKTDIAPAIGIYSEKQGTSLAAPYVVKANINTGTKAVGIFSAPDIPAVSPATTPTPNKSFIKYEGNQMTLGEGSTGFYVNGGTELASPTIDLNGGLVAYVTEGSTFKGGTATINLSKTGIGVYGERGAVVEVKNWIFNNKGNAAEEVRLKEGIAKVTTDKDLKPKMVLTHVINGETYLDKGKTVTAIADPGYTQEENIGLMAQGIKNTKVGITWDKGNDYEIINEGTIDFKNSIKSTAIYAESARVENKGTIKLGKDSTGIYGIYRDDSPKFKDKSNTEYSNKLEIDTTATSSISLGTGSTGMYLVNAQKLNTAAGGTIQSVTGATNNVGIYAINGKIDVPTTGTPAEKAEANAYNNKNANFNILNMKNESTITLGDGSVGIYSRVKEVAATNRNTVINTGNITVGKSLTNAPAVGIYAENTKLTNGTASVAPTITVGEKGIVFYGKNSEIVTKGTANYNNKGVLAYLDNTIFTSHYGNLTAHQNTMLFLKNNSMANMNGAGADIDITVPDKAATSDPFAGVYVEGSTPVLNGVKKINIGKNSNGIFMNNATFTSNVNDIVSTKEGAKGLLAKNSTLTNNSKITLSGNSSIGIYSDATVSPTKTVTNNGKLTISGKKTLGVFLKGSQTFVNTADIDVADTTSSVPAEKTVGIYTKDGTSTIKHNSGTINVGEKSIGIFSATSADVEVATPAKIDVKDEAIGIYKEKGTVLLKGEINVAPHTSTVKNSEPVGVYGLNGANITDNASKITVGAKSFGFILENKSPATTNKYTSTNTGAVSLGADSVFLYSNGQASLTNGRNISSSSDRVIAFYIKGNGTNRGDLTNNATIDLSNSKGSIGIYAPGGKATNKGRILVGETDSIDPVTGKTYTDVTKITYGIGMAADNGGHIINDNEIRIYGDKSIGMYGKGAGTKVENNSKIILDGSRATDTNKIQSMVGVYVDQGATFVNKGDIRTADAYAGKIVNGVQKVNNNVVGLVGVAVMNGSTLENHGNIDIDADESFGVVVRNSVIKNYGNFKINVRGRGTYGVSYKDISAADLAALEAEVNSKLKSDPRGQELAAAGGVNKSYEGVSITIQNGKPIFTRNGVTVSDAEVELIEKIIGSATSNLGMSDVGFYVDTLGRTKPIDINGATPPINSQLIVGTEYSELTNRKEWFVKDDVITPFLQQIQGRNFKLTSIAGSLTWMATPVIDNYGQIKGVAMTKIPYTAFVKTTHNAWNFADGLEQRYGVNALDSREKRVFNLLNSIGNNEEILLTQAYDEMMGHQYANVQQRIYETGRILNKEFSYLRNEWSNPTKDANKVKVFGTNGEYKTDTAGIIDYKYNAQGVAYVHEDETVRLGESLGWYAGIVHNKYKFDDIGNSKEEMLLGKFGMFKSVPFDENNSLNWTIAGDIFVGHNKMHRRFLVVSEIFNAKSRYYSYGIGVKNDLSKEFRLSENFTLKPYAGLRLEYGRMSKIKEKSGEVKLEVKSNDYISIKPEIGTELAYKAFFGPKSLKAAVSVAYENELGILANPKNKARVAGTSADWFNIRGEKEDRKGNVKSDLNIGIDNQRIGVTANVGYDTKGSNVRGGLGLRVIF